jgi:hypothetical protein
VFQHLARLPRRYAEYAVYVNDAKVEYCCMYAHGIEHRMDAPQTERIITPMPKPLVEAIDDYRFANRIASRAEAIRRLIEMGLEKARDG